MTSGSIEVTPFVAIRAIRVSLRFKVARASPARGGPQACATLSKGTRRVQPKTLITPIVMNRMTSKSIEVTPFVGIRAIRVSLPLRGYPRSAQDTNYTNCHESDDIGIN